MAAARRVHVLGGGALGTLFASHFARSGVPTTLLLRNSAAAGSRCDVRVTEDSHTIDMRKIDCEPSDGEGGPIDLLVVAVKAFAARSALHDVRARLNDASDVILLCNGALALAEEMTTPVLIATTTHGAWTRAPRDVHHAGRGETWIGGLPGTAGRSESARHFASHGLGAVVEDEAATERRLWLKLAANAVLNPLTGLWDVQNGEVLRRSEGRTIAAQICAEVAELAHRLSQSPAPYADELTAFVHECAAANALNFSSMCMDMRAGRQTEIDMLNGWVARRSRELHLAAPINMQLADAIRKRHP